MKTDIDSELNAKIYSLKNSVHLQPLAISHYPIRLEAKYHLAIANIRDKFTFINNYIAVPLTPSPSERRDHMIALQYEFMSCFLLCC